MQQAFIYRLQLITVVCLVFVGETVSAQTDIPFKQDSVAVGSMLLKAVAVLAVTAALLYAALKQLQRYIPRLNSSYATRDRGFGLVQSKRISPKQTLMLIKWDNKEYLVLAAGDHTSVIDQRDIGEQQPNREAGEQR